MVGTRRSKEQIMQKILEVCKSPATKTSVVYLSNLNFYTAKAHLVCLIDAGLLEVSGTKIPLYKTTPKGLIALKSMNAVRSFIDSEVGSSDQEPSGQSAI
jgi:predicted transcriptional regulator